jgi:hypothetical protein
MCGRAAYCNEECAHDDWSFHQSDCNIVTVPVKETVVAVPHAYHDVLPLKNFNAQDKDLVQQGYSIRHKASNGVVSQRIQTPLEQCDLFNPVPSRSDHSNFSIVVNGEHGNKQVIAKGTTLRNAIYNRAPGAGGQLASTRGGKGFTLWSPVSRSSNVIVSRHEPTTLRFSVPQLDKNGMVVMVPPLEKYIDYYQNMSRRARGAIEQQFQLKSVSAPSANVIPMIASDHNGRSVRMLFNVNNPLAASLIDIEYNLPVNSDAEAPEWDEEQFTCRPDDRESIEGLMLSIRDNIDYGKQEIVEYKEQNGHIRDNTEMQQLQDKLDGLESDYRIISDHYKSSFGPPGENNAKVSPEVRSAIYRLTQGQFKEIGAFTNPVSLARKGLTELEEKTDRWIEDYEKRTNEIRSMKSKRRVGDDDFKVKDWASRRKVRRMQNNAKNKLRVLRTALAIILKRKKIAGVKFEDGDGKEESIKYLQKRVNDALVGTLRGSLPAPELPTENSVTVVAN